MAVVAYTIPAAFPEPSKEVRALLTCPSGRWMASGASPADLTLFRSYAQSNPDFRLEEGSLAMKGYRISCEGEAIKLQGPDWKSTVDLIATTPTTSIGADRGSLVFRAFRRYRYPNLRLEPYWSDVLVTIASGSVSAHRSETFWSGDVVVALQQGGETTPVLFEGSTTTVSYTPMQDATLYVSRGRHANIFPLWDLVNFNYSEAWLTWQLRSDPPPGN